MAEQIKNGRDWSKVAADKTHDWRVKGGLAQMLKGGGDYGCGDG